MNGLLLATLIAVAGGLGSALRYLVSTAINEHASIRTAPAAASTSPAAHSPTTGTWAVNMIGSLALGIAAGAASQHIDADWFGVFAIGLCGGFTTFSTAALDVTHLTRQGRWRAAALNALGMLVVCVLLAGAGVWLGAKL